MFLFVLLSCATPFLKVKSDASVASAPTLMTTSFIRAVDENKRVNPFDVVRGEGMDGVGDHLTTQSIKMLGKQGFQVYLDKNHAQRLPIIEEDATAVLGGLWYSKDTSTTIVDNDTILLEPFCSSLVYELNTQKEDEHFLFVSARLGEKETFLIMRSVYFLIDYVMINDSGNVVFRARGIGDGTRSFLFADKSKHSLKLAIDNAIRSIETQKRQEL